MKWNSIFLIFLKCVSSIGTHWKLQFLFFHRYAFCPCIFLLRTPACIPAVPTKEPFPKIQITNWKQQFVKKISYRLGTYKTEAFIIFPQADQTSF
jgi:hypothetical protein